jgi:hypothetical protein
MTTAYTDKRNEVTKEPRTLFVITADKCSRVYGIAPCIAALGVTGSAKCYNTRKTCQDPPNYNKTTVEIKLGLHGQTNPLPGETVRPLISSEPKHQTTEIDPRAEIKSFRNASLSIKLYDETDNDIGIDPYVSERTSLQGTFWRNWLARNFYQGRPCELKRGFKGLAESDYVSSKYMIESIVGPHSDGTYTLTAKDILKKADKVKIPAPSSGKLAADISAVVTSITLDDSTGYPAPATTFYIRISDEIIEISANNTGTGVLTVAPSGRAVAIWNTIAETHDEGDKVQLCYAKVGVNVWDIQNDIMQNEVGILAADIDVTGNQTEADIWLQRFSFTGMVSKPVKASLLLTELCVQSNSFLFWSEDEQKVLLRAMKIPPVTPTILNETEHLKDLRVNPNEASRISRAYIYHSRRTGIGDMDKPESFARIEIAADLDAESVDQFGEPALREIFGRWIYEDNIASRLTSLLMRRFRNRARVLEFLLELKDADLKVGEFIKVITDRVVNFDGTTRDDVFYQVLKKQRKGVGVIGYKVLQANFSLRYGYIAPAGTPDYDSASTDEKLIYMFIGSAANKVGTFGEDGYYIF